MSITGIGALSSFGVATETTGGTPTGVVPDVFIPIVSESVQGSRNALPSGSIVGDSMVQAVADGVISVEGNVSQEFEGSVTGQSIWLWNGDTGYTANAIPTSAATAAPTPVGAAGGSLPDGTYRYKVSSVLQRTTDGRKLIMPASAEASVTTSSQPTVNVGFTIPSTGIPVGYTLHGTIIWRSAASGAANSEKYLATVVGSGTTYADTGAAALGASIPFYGVSLYRHDFIGSPPVTGDRLTPFTYYGCKNNDFAEQYLYCMMDQMRIGVGSLGDKVMAEFTLKGAQIAQVDNFSPVFVPIEPFVGWKCKGFMDGVADCTMENFSIQCGNGVVPVPGMCMVPYNRGVISGKREVSVSFARQFSDHDFWLKMVNGTEFALQLQMFGQSIVNVHTYGVTATQSGLAYDMVPWQYYTVIDLFRLKANKAGGNAGGPERIVESINAMAFKDTTENTEMKIQMWNTISAYA